MKQTTRMICVLLSGLLLLASFAAGCASSVDEQPANPTPTVTANTEPTPVVENSISYTPGSYTGVASGRNGDIVVEVTVSDAAIESVVITEHSETEGLADPAVERIPAEIVEYQSLGLDTVTGATITSAAILQAAANALEQSGANVSALRNVPVEKLPGETIEKTADVVVVGGGGAGITAAVSVADQGKSVILIEKTAALGGNTLASGGVWNAVSPEIDALIASSDSRTETLRSYLSYDESLFEGAFLEDYRTLKAQIEEYLAGDTSTLFDSNEFHLIQSYLGGMRTGLDGAVITGDYDLLHTLVWNSDATLKWLMETTGAEFRTDTLVEPIGALWLRAHVYSNSKWIDMFERPRDYVLANGGEILLECAADKLITEGGAVTGVHAVMADGTEVVLHANNGVVLATGGFAANSEMVKEYDTYWGDMLDDVVGTTNISATVGDGILMAQEAVDAAVTGMGFTQLNPGSFASDGTLALGNGSNVMYVTPEGHRFVDEYAERDVISIAAFEHGGEGGLFYEIGIKSQLEPSMSLWRDRDCYEADTLEELAGMIGIDPAVLTAEVEKYNGFVESGVDTDFGKTVFTCKIESVEGDSYIARAMRPSRHHTMGGLKIDTACHVYNTSGEIIPGLYAAGEVTGGIHAGNRLGGNAIADVFVFGRIAGANAANAE